MPRSRLSTHGGRELIDNDVAPSAVSANCVTAMPLFEPMYFRKSLIIVELRQTARIVSGIEWEHWDTIRRKSSKTLRAWMSG